MNPILLTITGFSKKQIAPIGVAIVVIMFMPVLAVFSLGQNALTYLADTVASDSTTTAISTTTVGLYEGPEVTGDTYAWGNCTYWVYALRLKSGDAIPTTWGNAATWALYARLDGYEVNQAPSPGSIMQTANVANGLGHVAYVTAVDPTTGVWTISEMNVKG